MVRTPGREVDNGITQQDAAEAVSAPGSRCTWLGEGGVGVGAWFSSDSRKSLVRMHMHEGGMNRIILDAFLLFSLVYGEHFPLSE